MYYLDVISLEGCPFCNALEDLLNKTGIKFNLTKVKYNDKELFKTEQISSYPQIYLKKKNSKINLLVGGYDIFKKIIEKINTKPDIKTFVDELKESLDPKFNKKSILRLIELLTIRNN